MHVQARLLSLTWWIGLLFAVGSACFAGASIVAQWGSASVTLLAALIQLAGTILFNLSTLHALQGVERVNLRVWTPDVFGSVCFLVSSGMAYRMAGGPWTRDWWITALNLLGSVAFGVAAVASLVEPSTSEPVSAGISNVGTALGGLCFLAGAILLMPGED